MSSTCVYVFNTGLARGNSLHGCSANSWSIRMARYGAQLMPKVIVINLQSRRWLVGDFQKIIGWKSWSSFSTIICWNFFSMWPLNIYSNIRQFNMRSIKSGWRVSFVNKMPFRELPEFDTDLLGLYLAWGDFLLFAEFP